MSDRGRQLRSVARLALTAPVVLAAVVACGETVTQVTSSDVVELRVFPDSALVAVGRTLQLRALPLDSTGALLFGQTPTWTSLNTSVVTVDGEGLVTGVAEGAAEVSAMMSGLEARASLIVVPAPLIVLSDDTVRFTAVAGGADPAPDSVRITNGGGLTLEELAVDSIVYDTGVQGWLTARARAATAPTAVELTVSMDGVTTAGDHGATVWVSVLDADNTPAPITVVLTVEAGPAASVAADEGDAQTATVGTSVATPPSVVVTDAFGNPVEGVDVAFAVTAGDGSVMGASPRTDAGGIARVGSWTLGTAAGANTLSATVAGLPAVVFTATGAPGGAATLEIDAGDAQNAVAGSAVAVRPRVVVRDALGNGVPGVAVTFEVTSGDGTVTGASPTTDAAGLASVGSWTLGTTAGPNTLRATAAGVTDPVTFTATGITGDAVGIQLEAGDAQTDTVAATLPVAYAVKVVDSNGNGVEGISVSWSVTGGGGTVTASSDTDTDGVSAATRVLGTIAGSHTAEAAVGGLSGSPVVFDATALPGAPAMVAAAAGQGQSATVGTAVAVAPSVSVTDQFGNAIEGHEVTFSVTGGGGSVSPTTPIATLADGTATVTSWTLGTAAGTNNNALQALAAGAGLAGNPTTFTASADADAPASIAVFSGDGQEAVTGTAVANPPTVRVADRFGNAVAGATVDFTPTAGASVGSPSPPTNASGDASTSWTIGVTGSTPQTDGTFPDTLTATVRGTAFTTRFTADAIYSYLTHVDSIWTSCGNACHSSPGASGLALDGTPAQNYAALVNVQPNCDTDDSLSPSYRRISPVGGDPAALDFSILLRFMDPDLPGIDECAHPFALDGASPSLAIIKAWVRNSAPNN